MKPMLARDLMTVGVPTCKTSTPVLDIARFLLENNAEEMVVLDEEGHGVGVVGFEQLVAVYGQADAGSLAAEQVMSEGVPDLPADVPLPLAAQMLRDRHIRVGYMLHNSAGITYPAGYLSYRHILRHMAARDESELRTWVWRPRESRPSRSSLREGMRRGRRAGLRS